MADGAKGSSRYQPLGPQGRSAWLGLWMAPHGEHIANREQIGYIASLITGAGQRALRIPAFRRETMAQAAAALRLVEGNSMDKSKALDAALSQIERAFGKGSIMRLGKNDK